MCTRQGHFQDIPPTFFTGAIMGAITAGVTRRPIVSGILTISGLCTAVQLVWNEFSMGFSRLTSTYYNGSATKADVSNLPITNAERRDALDSPTEPKLKSLTWLQKSPVQPITDDEYRQRLLARQREIDAELSIIEEELLQRRRALQAMNA
ncbi:unnamed protein product [Malassezia sympodialis ATCC 42132]|uniref:uncharacterized protein n=1 Tax=Malassezia sympodialis (strain ATCC 42132) TaxID=1230383 RepID=UPI0002C26AE2|nr:uncharacterized protein MSY001_2097 [Malassezia sympodialis ATCC 42132]CCU99391.1 unnamed protein product [Malassezia sympodialis ATCC 42132]|eukprot:XP_018740644.1 uncharacterized protein MSY001_2097 [Malassezia sympodialis ATCC 42132]